jgi:predicted ATPase
VQLFDQCALRVWQHFQLAAEAPAVAEIRRLVEGLPLGVELAAALMQTQPCVDIARAIAANLHGDRHRDKQQL